ncbi:hypothetical protein HaLaN_26325, partial [Haematococcus lacustris]
MFRLLLRVAASTGPRNSLLMS